MVIVNMKGELVMLCANEVLTLYSKNRSKVEQRIYLCCGIILFVLLLVFAVWRLVGGANQTAESAPIRPPTLLSVTQEVSPGVYDDGQSTAYIRPNDVARWGNLDQAVASIILKKQQWEKTFPNKKVVSITSISFPNGAIMLHGLLIHYEIR